MVKLGGTFLKATDCKAGDKATIINEGEWVETKYTYPDGNPKNMFTIMVRHNGDEKEMRLNTTNRNALISAFGNDTKDWVGRSVDINIIKVSVQGKLVDGISLTGNSDKPVSTEEVKKAVGGEWAD